MKTQRAVEPVLNDRRGTAKATCLGSSYLGRVATTYLLPEKELCVAGTELLLSGMRSPLAVHPYSLTWLLGEEGDRKNSVP